MEKRPLDIHCCLTTMFTHKMIAKAQFPPYMYSSDRQESVGRVLPRTKLRLGRERPAKEKERKNYGDEIRGGAARRAACVALWSGGWLWLATIFHNPEAICCPILNMEQIYREEKYRK